MEDSFRVRVDKVFGSLSAPSSSTPWTLSDEEIEKKEWGRSTSPETLSDEEIEKKEWGRSTSPETLSDEEIEKKDARSTSPDHLSDGDDLVQQIRSSVGLDCTLDYEEEEDEFDKVALGQEDEFDHLYMSDYGIDVELPDSFHQASRDPRANHSAARVRLREDAHLNPNPILKPILKTRQSCVDAKSSKRVHFHHQSLPSHHDSAHLHHSQHHMPDDGVSPPDRLPDYLRNPAKYTRYTLDSSHDMDEASNRKAYMDLFNMLNKKHEEASQHPLTHTPVTFTPINNKFHNSSSVKEQGEASKGKVAAVRVARDDEACVMDEIGAETALDDKDCVTDEMGMETVRNKITRKPGRHYRMRTSLDSDIVNT